MPWLIELLGPQHAGKTTVADIIALTLEENGIPAVRVETDNYLYNLFPIYVKLKATEHRQEAHKLLLQRWRFIHSLLTATTKQALKGHYTVIHDHVDSTSVKRGIARRIAKQAHAEYLSVFVTAPLDTLKERWRQSEINDVKIEELEKTYRRFQTLQENFGFDVTIDTSLSPPEEAARKIISATYPDLKIPDASPPVTKREEPQVLSDDRPKICSGNLQILKLKDSYVIVYNHHRYITDEQGLLILSLCNGKNSLEEIAKIAGADLDTTKSTLNFLRNSEITKATDALEHPRAPIQVYPTEGASNRRRVK